MNPSDSSGEPQSGQDAVREESVSGPIRGTMMSRLVGGSAVSLLGFVVTVLQAILQVPLLLAVWPTEAFAAWVTALAMHALLVSPDTGLHNFIGVEANLIGLNRHAEVRRLYAAALRIWVVFSVLQLVIAAVVFGTPELASGIHAETAHMLRAAAGPFVILAVQWVAVGSMLGLLCRVLLAGGQTVLFQWLGVIHRSVLFVATVAAAYAGLRPLGVAWVYGVVASISGAVTIAYVLRHYPEVIPRWGDGSWRSGWQLFSRSTGLTAASVLEQSSVGGLMTVVAGVFRELEVAAFSTMRSLANFVTQAATVVMNPTAPEFGRSATPETIKNAGLMIDVAYIIGTSALAAVVSFASPWIPGLYASWTRHELPFDAMLCVGIIVAVLVRQVGGPLHHFLYGTNRVRAQFNAAAIRAAALYGSLPACIAAMGISGVGVAMAAGESCCVAYFAVVTAKVFRELGGAIPSRSSLLATAQVLVSLACLVAVLVMKGPAFVCVALAAAAHAVLLVLQLRRLPASLLSRLVSSVSPSWRRSHAGVPRA
jgi:O-antigen/teichoic acid export membrane protein